MHFKDFKIVILLLLVFCLANTISAQQSNSSNSYKILSSNLGVAGSSKVVSTHKGHYKISQSIGQSGVIGTFSSAGYYLRQGYQQPINSNGLVKPSNNNNLLAKVYPNPFAERVLIAFNETLTETINILIFDISGKLIYNKNFSPSKTIQLQLNELSSGSYLIKCYSNGKQFNAKLIRL